MINALKIVFGIILVTMLIVTTKASLAESILKIPQVVQADPWFQTTLVDAYCGFITFYCWVFYKESAVWSRILWFVLIMLLGNIAMAAYMLIKLLRLPANATASSLLLNDKGSVQ